MAKSEVSDGLIAAYRATAYRVKPGVEPGCDAIILRVGHYSEPLSRLFAASGHRCAAFITACNPFSMPQSDERNLAACARLYDKLNRQLGNAGRIRDGEGDASGAWPGEKSFLALGLDLETAQALGTEFRQNAIVWADSDAIPRLVLLR